MSDDSSASSTDEEMDGASPPRPWEGPADKPGVTRLPSCPLQPCIESCTPQLGPLTHQCSSRWCTQPIRGGLSFRDEPILRQQVVTKGITDTQEKAQVIADEKMVRFTTFGEALNGTSEALRMQDQVIRTCMSGKEQERKTQFEECNKKLIEVIQRANADFGAASSQQGWQQGSSDRPTYSWSDRH